MKRIFAVLLSLTLLLGASAPALAATPNAIAAANVLYSLGLFAGKGTNPDGSPNFALDDSLNRYEAATMIVRLLGKEEEALASDLGVPFTDFASGDLWALPYVGYAYNNGYVNGTSTTTFSGKNVLKANEFLTLVLRVLGYISAAGGDFLWNSPWDLTDRIGLTDGSYNAATNESFTRGDLAIICNSALDAYIKGSSLTLRQFLGKANGPATSLEGIWSSVTDGGSVEFVFSGNTFTMANYASDGDIIWYEGNFVYANSVITRAYNFVRYTARTGAFVTGSYQDEFSVAFSNDGKLLLYSIGQSAGTSYSRSAASTITASVAQMLVVNRVATYQAVYTGLQSIARNNGSLSAGNGNTISAYVLPFAAAPEYNAYFYLDYIPASQGIQFRLNLSVSGTDARYCMVTLPNTYGAAVEVEYVYSNNNNTYTAHASFDPATFSTATALNLSANNFPAEMQDLLLTDPRDCVIAILSYVQSELLIPNHYTLNDIGYLHING